MSDGAAIHSIRATCLLDAEATVCADMAWTELRYSKAQVDRAGELIRVPQAVALPQYSEAMDVVGNWRTAHNYPLNIFQYILKIRAGAGTLVARRIKRLSSILRKLNDIPSMRLSAMQDIGGCRAVVPSIDRAYALAELYKRGSSGFFHNLLGEKDYIQQPKPSGYRGLHLIYGFQSKRRPNYNSLKVEIQIRTTFQHAWATAVETIDILTSQALKSSSGSMDWLRFFSLMGQAIAIMEKNIQAREARIDVTMLQEEIRALSTKLDVESHLFAHGAAITYSRKVEDAHYFLLLLDPPTRRIHITSFKRDELERANKEYGELEKQIDETDKNAVLVSVDSIKSLPEAYPNYYLDIHNFIILLREAVK